MVTQYGMSDDMGPIYLGGDHDEVFLARDYGQQSRTYSEDVAARIDAEVQRKMNDALGARYGDPYRAPRSARRPFRPAG